MYCPNCGHENRESSKFCAKCGQRMSTGSQASAPVHGRSQTPPMQQWDEPSTQWGGGQASSQWAPPQGGAQPQYQWGGDAAWEPGVSEAADQHPVKKRKIALFVIGALAGLGFLAALVAVGLYFFVFSKSSDQMLVVFPSRGDAFDIYRLKVGQEADKGLLLVEDAVPTSDVYMLMLDKQDRFYRYVAGRNFGTFLQGTDALVYWYLNDDGDVVLKRLSGNGDTPTEIMETDALPLFVYAHEGTDRLFIKENRSNTERCYIAEGAAAAERVTKGDVCNSANAGRLVYDVNQEDEGLTVTFSDSDDELEIEGLSSSYGLRVSDDAAYLAYVRHEDEDEATLCRMERASGEETVIRTAVRVAEYGFLGDTAGLLCILGDDPDEVELWLSDPESSIAQAYGIAASGTPDGKHIVYMLTDEDGESTVYSYDVQASESLELMSEDGLQFGLSTVAEKILMSQYDSDSGDYLIYSADYNGNNLQTVVDLQNIESAYVAVHRETPNDLFAFLEMEDGDALYHVSLSNGAGNTILEDWYNISVLAFSKGWLVFSGIEDSGDDPVLYAVQLSGDAEPVELDGNEESFLNAVITANGAEVIYTARTGDDSDDIAVKRISLSGEEAPEVLYDEAQLVSASWAETSPTWETIYWLEITTPD